MANDSSQDPIAQAKLDRIEAELVSLRRQVQESSAAIGSAAEETKRAAGAVERKGVAGQGGTGEKTSAAEPEAIQRATVRMERLAAAEQAAARAAAERLGSQQAEVGAIQEATAALGKRVALDESAVTAATARIEAIRAQTAALQEQGAVLRENLALGGGRGPRGETTQRPAATPVVPPAPAAAAERAQAQAQAESAAGAPPARTPQFDLAKAADDTSRLSARQQALLESARALAPAETAVSASMEYQSRVMSLSSLEYQRHGALTTEFIAAAAKGQTTLRELGDQMLLTIGKFAGWTGAAAATYGALGALTAVGRGAVDTASGVNQLSRFLDNIDTTKAQEQFRSLSQQNNVSIKDAADAEAAFSKIFQNQDQAYAAANIALKATQLDNISLADSTRYLTGAIVGFRLPASQLPQVFDQINNAQRRFGASVAQTLAAMGGSAAAVHNAGGDFNEYVALVTAAQRATAQTGSVIGTAFRRSATTFVTKPQNQEILRSFGLDPTEAYTQLLLDAVNKAKGLNGQEINKLAQGLGGPQQGARVFAGLLQRPDLVAKALDVTDPMKANGSAAAEMKDRLAQADQVIKSVGHSLERLGSSLAQSGALTPFVGLLEGFGKVADLVSHLLDLINKLPGGLSSVLVPLGEVYGIFKLLSNRDLGALIPERFVQQRPNGLAAALRGTEGNPGVLRPSVDYAARKDFEKGVDEQKGYYQELQANSAKTAARLTADVEFQKRYVAGLVQSEAPEAQIIAEQEKLVALQANQARTIALEVSYRESIAELDANRAAYLAGMRTGLSAEQAALAAGFNYRPGTVERPGGGGAIPVPLGGVYPDGRETGAGPGQGSLFDRQQRPLTGAGEQLPLFGPTIGNPSIAVEREAATRFAAVRDGLTGRLAGLNTSLAEQGTGGRLLARAFETAGGAAAATTSVVGGALSSALTTFSAAISPLTAALIGLPLLLEGVSQLSKSLESGLNASITAAHQGLDPNALDVQARNAKSRADSTGEKVQSALEHFSNIPNDLLSAIGGVPNEDAPTVRELDQQAAKYDAASAKQIRYQQHRGRALPESRIQDVTQRTFDSGNAQQQEQAIARGWSQIAVDFERIYGTGQQGAQSVKRYYQFVNLLIASHARSGQDLRGVVNRLGSGADVEAFLNQNQGRFDVQGPTSKLGYEGAAAAQARVAELIAKTSLDSKDLPKLVQAYRKAGEQIKTNASAAETDALTLAGSDPQAQIAARAAHLDRLGGNVRTTSADLRDLLTGYNDKQRKIHDLRTEISRIEDSAGAHALGGFGDALIGIALTGKKSELEKLIVSARGNHSEVSQLRQLLDQQKNDLKVAQTEADQANLQAETALNDAKGAYLASLTNDPVQQAAINLNTARSNYLDFLKSKVHDPAQKFRDLQAIQNASQQGIDAQLSQYQAGLDASFAQADIGATQQTQLQNAVSKAQQLVGHIQGLGKKLDPSKLAGALQGLYSAQGALVSYMQQQRLDNIDARFQLLAAQTDQNPVTLDRIDLRHLEAVLPLQKTHADAVKIRAQILDTQRKTNDDKVSAREADINFQLGLNEITNQQAISDLQALLKVKDLSYARRKEIQQQIQTLFHAGQTEASGFDLAVGNIKLPTAYDVRRAFDEAGAAVKRSDGAVVVHNNNVINITATNKEAETAVYHAVDRLLHTQIRQAARVAGAR